MTDERVQAPVPWPPTPPDPTPVPAYPVDTGSRRTGRRGLSALEALERDQLLASERAARAAAERAARRLGALVDIASGLGDAADPETIGERVVQAAMHGLAAQTGALCLLDDDGRRFSVVASIGMMSASVAGWERFDLDAPLPAGDAVRTRQPVLLRSQAERDARYPLLRGRDMTTRAYAVVPLQWEERPLGVIALGWNDPGELLDDDGGLLVAAAQQCAQAVERGRLFRAEREASARFAFLAEAGAQLSSSLDHRETLRRVAELLVPAVADQASVHALSGDSLVTVAVTHADPETQARLREVSMRENGRTTDPVILEVARTGEGVFVVSDPEDSAHPDAEVRALVTEIGIRSGAVLPLESRGRVLGVLTAATNVSGRSWTEHDRVLLETVARRAATALDNARSHEAVQATAATLQRSLLPARLPRVPGLQVAARYRSAGDGSEPGGDVYDVWPLYDAPDTAARRFAMLVGDVSGKGVSAAALTALLRYTARAAAFHASGPADVMQELNTAVLTTGPDIAAVQGQDGLTEAFATAVYTETELLADGVDVRLACGGHPAPVLRTADGVVRSLDVGGSAIGLFASAVFREHRLQLRPGDVLVLFTDGYVEARSVQAGWADDGLVPRVIAEAGDVDAETLASLLESAVVDYQNGLPRDDMALLVLRAT